MPVLEFPAIFVGGGLSPLPLVEPATRLSARVRFGRVRARRFKHRRRPRRPALDLDVLTMSGTHRAALVSLTLYGATLASACRLKRREMVALRLPDGTRVSARVRWRFGRQNGVSFLNPVADFAHLLRESQKARGSRGLQRSNQRVLRPALRQQNLTHRLQCALVGPRRVCRQLLRWCRSL
jgi:hypothetical protein